MERDRRLDTLRGLLLVIMTVDHVGGPMSAYTYEGAGYVSALEGFLFLSGFTCAAVYGTGSPRLQAARVFRRAWMIYRYQLALVLLLPLFTITAFQRAALGDWVGSYLSQPATYLGLAALGLHQPVYMDILPKYVILLLVSPLLLMALQRGFGEGVLAASVLVWAAARWLGTSAAAAWSLCPACRQGPEYLIAWQLVWVAGMYCGARYRSARAVVPSPLLLTFALAAVVLLFLARHAWIDLGIAASAVDEVTLGWIRVLDLCVIGLVVAAALQRVAPDRGVSWLALLGRSSLQVFAFHVVLMYLLLPYHGQLQHIAGNAGLTLATIVVVAALTLPALVNDSYRRHRGSVAAEPRASQVAALGADERVPLVPFP